MRAWIVVVVAVIALCACSKKKEAADKAPVSTEPAAPANPTPAVGGAHGSASADPTTMPPPSKGAGAGEEKERDDLVKPKAEPKTRMPSDDGGEATPKPMPSDDGGEAAKKACNKKADCGGDQDCCNGFCYKQGTSKHSIECKLPSGKL